jgi:hypothetical protein
MNKFDNSLKDFHLFGFISVGDKQHFYRCFNWGKTFDGTLRIVSKRKILDWVMKNKHEFGLWLISLVILKLSFLFIKNFSDNLRKFLHFFTGISPPIKIRVYTSIGKTSPPLFL